MDKLRVFISSTQIDLQHERDSVESVVEDLGHECIRAETYDSPGTSPQDVCRNMALQCDIYIGIFGARYGYKVPGVGMSVTEMEYQEARKSNPGKVFIYIKNTEKVETKQIRFLKNVQDFSDGYFRHDRFNSCDELIEQIRRDIVTWTTRRVRESLVKEIEIRALRDKIAYISRVMELYGIPEDLR